MHVSIQKNEPTNNERKCSQVFLQRLNQTNANRINFTLQNDFWKIESRLSVEAETPTATIILAWYNDPKHLVEVYRLHIMKEKKKTETTTQHHIICGSLSKRNNNTQNAFQFLLVGNGNEWHSEAVVSFRMAKGRVIRNAPLWS